MRVNRILTAQFDIILLSGDFVAHDLWAYSKARTYDVIRNISMDIERFLPGVPVVWVPGNHEGVPQDAFMTKKMEGYAENGPTWLYQQLAHLMRPLQNEEQQAMTE